MLRKVILITLWAWAFAGTAAWAQTPAKSAFDLRINAPANLADMLTRHLELQRYRSLTDLDATELTRLLQAAERNTRDLLATRGYFAPTVTLTTVDTPQSPTAPVEVVLSGVALHHSEEDLS